MKKNKAVVSALILSVCSATLATADVKEANWDKNVGISFSNQSGNTDKTATRLDLGANYKNDPHEVLINAFSNYGETEDDKDTENGTLDVIYNYLLSNPRLFLTVPSKAEYDDIADLQYRYTSAIGFGIFLVKEETVNFSINLGPNYLFEKLAGETDDYAGIRFGLNGEKTFESGARIWISSDYAQRVDNTEDYLLNGTLGIEAPLGNGLGLRLLVEDKYNNQPAAGRVCNDLTTSAGFTYKF